MTRITKTQSNFIKFLDGCQSFSQQKRLLKMTNFREDLTNVVSAALPSDTTVAVANVAFLQNVKKNMRITEHAAENSIRPAILIMTPSYPISGFRGRTIEFFGL